MSTESCVKPFWLVHLFYLTKRGKWRGQCSTWMSSPPCYGNNRRQRLRDQFSIASTDVMLLVAFTHWRGQAEFGMTLMCHLDLDTSSVLATNVAWYLCASVCRSVIGFAQAGKCGCPLHNPTRAGFLGRYGAAETGALWLVNGWDYLMEAVRCWRGLRGGSINIQKRKKKIILFYFKDLHYEWCTEFLN